MYVGYIIGRPRSGKTVVLVRCYRFTCRRGDDNPKRLFILSAGNTDPGERKNYPDSNMGDGIHDPAQAWNALTVGGYTDKITIDGVKWPGWQPLAPYGDLAPSSCTSTTWGRWPIKPDIVMEAGNLATGDGTVDPADLDDLQLLTTAHDFSLRPPLSTFGDTSAAAALAARYAAIVWAKYSLLTPETVRALMVHFAEWTPAMLARFTSQRGDVDYKNLLRCFGYGVPNLPRLLSSLDNSLTLVAESELRPFFKDEGRVKTREMRPHPLPWPTDVLNGLGATDVTMRVTLSYFIEPSPGARGWVPRYGYQSHGLRFAVRNPLETVDQFEERINKAVREEGYEPPGLQDPGWQFGRGSGLTSIGSNSFRCLARIGGRPRIARSHRRLSNDGVVEQTAPAWRLGENCALFLNRDDRDARSRDRPLYSCCKPDRGPDCNRSVIRP